MEDDGISPIHAVICCKFVVVVVILVVVVVVVVVVIPFTFSQYFCSFYSIRILTRKF